MELVNSWAQYSDSAFANEDQQTKYVGSCPGHARRWLDLDDPRDLRCDQSITFRNRAIFLFLNGFVWRDQNPSVVVKAHAIAPTVGTPSLSGEAAFSIDVDGNVNLGTFSTNVNVTVEYKKLSDPLSAWLPWTSSSLSGTSEVSQPILTTTITGLVPQTEYVFRLHLNRASTTNPTKDFYSGIANATTEADAPDVRTTPASTIHGGAFGVSDDGGANLNGIVTRNGFADAEWRFAWDVDSGEPYANDTPWIPTTVDSGGERTQVVLTGLTEAQQYFFRLEVRYDLAGTPAVWTFIEGDEFSFTIPASPEEIAAQEAQMHIYEYDAIQGEDKNVYFSYRDVATNSSDRFLTTAVFPGLHPTDTSGGLDVLIYIDGVLKTTNSGKPDNAITQIGSTTVYSLVVDGTTELTGEDVIIQFIDQDGVAIFRDFSVHVRTLMKTSQFDADASGLTNESGFIATGIGAGHGIEAVGGASGFDIRGALGSQNLRQGTLQTHVTPQEAKLDDGADANDDYYNGGILGLISGPGAGQSRPIVAYNGTTFVVKLSSPWTIQPEATTDYSISRGQQVWTQFPAVAEEDSELSAVPTSTSGYGEKLQFLFQRFAFKIDQTATQQTWYKSLPTGGTLGIRTVDDNGERQIIGKLGA
jgi:hypothetical protein